MIIKSIADNIRKQNWFTVFIEFVIVVAGIFFALQVDDWNQSLKDKQEETQVLKRLVRDLETDQVTINKTQEFYAGHLATLVKHRDIIYQKILSEEDLEQVASYPGAHIQEIVPRTTTYDEVINSGKLYKLSNQEMVDQIIDYYRLVDFHIYQNRQTRNEFRALFYGPALTEKWYWVVHPERDKLARDFFSKQDTVAYKALMQSAGWSVAIINQRINANSEILKKNQALAETIASQLTKKP